MPRSTEIDWEWRQALRAARDAYEAKHRRTVSQVWIGEEVAKLRGYPKRVSDTVVSDWMNGRVPGFRDGVALGLVLEADLVELAILRRPTPPIVEQPPVEQQVIEKDAVSRRKAGGATPGTAGDAPRQRGPSGRTRP